MKNSPILLNHLAELDNIKDVVQAEWSEKIERIRRYYW